jgi:tetratricopeptide (TPR) repeat protein
MVDVLMEDLSRLRTELGARYRIDRELGRGGMARVYLARDLRHDRDVALKVLQPEVASSLGTDRFLREIRIEASLQHPHILPLHDSGVAGGLLYYVMPYVSGETLRDRLAREIQLPLADALRITGEVADALSYAHGQNVIHRDIKPGNILLSDDHAVVADFGIARAMTAAAGDQVTEGGIALGTPEYMSPEQATGETFIDGRSDVYALGCVLYEMLAGEPPFSGRTVQAILARHLSDPPPPLRVRRPQVPPAVEAAVMTALAKVPADRFATAHEFALALEGRTVSRRASLLPYAVTRHRLLPVLAVLSLLAGVALWRFFSGQQPGLDPNRVMVFPLSGPTGSGMEGAGEAVATYIGYALEGTAPLRWLEGQEFMGDHVAPVSIAAAKRISRAERARYYIDGVIIPGRDTMTIVLRLHDLEGDSVLRRAGASSRADLASLPQLGLRAVSDLLPSLLEPGRKVDLSALSERRPLAVANFLQGERDYRRMRFQAALDHYQAALEADSALAIAALKGAAAANWMQAGEQTRLIGLALERASDLPPRLGIFARGLSHYISGEADSALTYLHRALATDSTWSEAWMALGEVYYHLIPRLPSLDSLAETAFDRARRADSSFTPPLFHLAEIALRDGDIPKADRLLQRLRLADPDSTFSRPLSLMYRCVQDGPRELPWARAAERSATEVLAVALALGASNPACARTGFETVLASPSVAHHWGALLGLQSLLAAMGRVAAVDSLLESAQRAGLPGHGLYLLDAAAGTGFETQARKVAAGRGHEYEAMPGPNLWLLGVWEARFGQPQNLVKLKDVAERRAAATGARSDSLFARIFAAYASLMEGDSADAKARFARLTPGALPASQRDLEWQPWEALAGERLRFAELLLADGFAAQADSVLAELDSHRAVVYMLYLPATLHLRARAAEAMGKPDLAATHRRRVEALRREAPAIAVSRFTP